jgi:hypothetical protein
LMNSAVDMMERPAYAANTRQASGRQPILDASFPIFLWISGAAESAFSRTQNRRQGRNLCKCLLLF